MTKTPTPPDNRDAVIRQLNDRLYFTRRTLIKLMPKALREPLEAATWCKSFEDIQEWEAWAIQRLLLLVDERPGDEMGGPSGTLRAYCPLCGGGSQGPAAQGYALPVGMRRHLEGSHGSRRCEVFSAAIDPCFEEIAEKAKPGYRGPNWEGLRTGLPPWKIVPPEPVRPSAVVINFPGK